MLADIEKLDKTFEMINMPDPKCNEAYCDTCGDCLICNPHDETDYCAGGYWVIYDFYKQNPFFFKQEKGMFYRIELDYGIIGIFTKNDIVTETPPIAKWMIGKNINTIKNYVIKKQGEIMLIEGK